MICRSLRYMLRLATQANPLSQQNVYLHMGTCDPNKHFTRIVCNLLYVLLLVNLNTKFPLFCTRVSHTHRYCLYPQELVLRIDPAARIRKLQLLSHQYMIASKIELFVGRLPSDAYTSIDQAQFTRLGYISLSDNEQTGFRVSVFVYVYICVRKRESCLLYTSPSPRDATLSRMPSSA